jgi:four helix bundle protein
LGRSISTGDGQLVTNAGLSLKEGGWRFLVYRRVPTRRELTLTDQIRRSSRWICANIAEAWRKRRYEAAFVSKLNDSETEGSETQVHLEIAFNHGYIDRQTFEALDDKCDKIISQIVKMIDQADRWIIKPVPVKRRSVR